MFPNLEAEQARRHKTNQQLAEFLGISRVSFESKKKSGKFHIDQASKLCNLFGVSFEYLFSTDEVA